MLSQNSKFSFIIPTLNEEKTIKDAILSIKTTMPEGQFEIIVSDNGSLDKTRAIAYQNGARVIEAPTATIAELRNLGAKESHGDFLVFIDADVCLDHEWYTVLTAELSGLPDSGFFITGSVCTPPPNSGFIERNWFNNLSTEPQNYINSGHLVTTRKLFENIKGFNEELKTSEDYDFCQRAIQFGAQLTPLPQLIAFHHGFPKTVKQFFMREAWHGKEDLKTFGAFLKSKTALIALSNFFFLVLTFTLLILNIKNIFFYSSLVLSIVIPIISTIKKFPKNNRTKILTKFLLMEIYLLGRALSLFLPNPRPARNSS